MQSKLKIEEKIWNLDKLAEINTVDSFQGREKEIIIISWVRAGGEGTSIGFLNDFRRMNVAITRAKNHLFIVGHSKTLNQNKDWNKLITHWKSNKRITQYHSKAEMEKSLCFTKIKEEFHFEQANNNWVPQNSRNCAVNQQMGNFPPKWSQFPNKIPILKRIKTKEAGDGVPKTNETKPKHNKNKNAKKRNIKAEQKASEQK